MKFNEIEQINWINTYKVDKYISWDKDITIFDVKKDYATNIFNDYVDFLLKWWKLLDFDKVRNTIDNVYWDIILIEYNNKTDRDNDNNLMDSKINIINPIKSEKLNWNRQIAEPIWKLDLNWKYYLFLYPYNWTTTEINPDLWIYKWVIINPELYFWKVENQVDDTENKVKDIL
jgi:hypothetical protein